MLAAATSYSYGDASRLAAVASGSHGFAYACLSNSELVATVTASNGAQGVMTTAKTYDKLSRLTSISSTRPPTLDTLSSFAYAYNAANQRLQSTLADGSYWLYEYDALGQITSAVRHWPSGAPVAGQSFGYAFDDIGNRTSAAEGESPAEPSTYSANALNQYTQRTVPGMVAVRGEAEAAATVTVTIGAPPPIGTTYPADRYDRYFRALVPVDNAESAVWQDLQIVGVRPGASPDGKDIVSEQTGRLFVPQTPEPFVHDDDGNLVQDGRWLYTWDAENRLVAIETRADLPAAVPRLRLEFAYDSQSRRISKKVFSWDAITSAFSLQLSSLFVYDGWLLLAELNAADGSAIRTYTWGLDFSGTLQGAGGIGGVLCVNVGGAAPAASLPCYDGNGNVVALADSATGALVAQYEYDPFGNPLRATGPAAAGNPFRFSTKYTDAETGLLYYGYRYLSTETGRWLGRDPLEEAGGEGLYSQCSNDGVNCLDPLGLFGAGRVARMQSMARDGRLQETTTDHFYAGAISEYSRVPYTAAELRAVVATNSPVPLGHSDFYNPYSDFDFNKEDNDWKTSPVPSWGIGLHFMDIAGAQKRVSEATAACEIDRFERAVHCLQDSQSHTNNGYTGHWWGGAPFGAVFLLTSAVYIDVPGAGHPVLPWRNDNPDRDSRVAAAWLFAELDTHRAVDDWYAACTKCNGSWVRKSAASGASAATGVNP